MSPSFMITMQLGVDASYQIVKSTSNMTLYLWAKVRNLKVLICQFYFWSMLLIQIQDEHAKVWSYWHRVWKWTFQTVPVLVFWAKACWPGNVIISIENDLPVWLFNQQIILKINWKGKILFLPGWTKHFLLL